MLKLTTTEPKDIKSSTFVIAFPCEGRSSAFCTSLFTMNYPFTSIGYYYSEHLAQAISHCPHTGLISHNGEMYFNSQANITLLHFRSGVPSCYQKDFDAELITFINANAFKKVFILGGLSKDKMNDFEIQSLNVNVYHISNDDSIDFKASSILKFADHFQAENSTKTYQEMDFVLGCTVAKAFIQAMVTEKMKFGFVFTFCDELFDPLAGYALFNKMESLLKLNQENLISIPKKAKTKYESFMEISKNIKVDQFWGSLLTE